MKHALRSLAKSPGFTAVALVTLALGIGVNSSMYSLMNTLLFASAPFPRSESILNVFGRTPQAEFMNLSSQEVDELRAHPAGVFTAVAARTGVLENVTVADQPIEQVQGTAAQAELFKVLETPPLLGRVFSAEECVAGRDAVVLLTEDFWRTKFAGRPEAVGQTLRINGRVFTIIGVLPKAYSSIFIFGESQYFRPLVYSESQITGRDRRESAILARLSPGLSLTEALARLAPLAERWTKDHPRYYRDYQFRLQLAGRVGGSANVTIITLQLGLAAAILAIACANLANLQMARATSRIRELAIRSALGASRARLLRQQLTESIIVSVAGGGLGLLVARWCNDLVGRNIRLGLNNTTLHLPIDGRVLAFTAAVSILAGLGFGLVPAWLASRTDVNEALKAQSRGTTGDRGHGWIRRILVIGQVALSLTLLSVAGLMVQGLNRTINFRPAWDSESILTANVQIDESVYNPEQRRTFYEKLLTRLERIPGVESATLANRLPTGNGGGVVDILTEKQDPNARTLPKGQNYLITPGYFKTLGIRLVEGRLFPPGLSVSGPEQVVINQSLARGLWPNESAIGQRLGAKSGDGKVVFREVIGVVSDAEDAIKFQDPPTTFQFYTPLAYQPWTWFQIAIRGQNPARFGNDLRLAAADVSPDVVARFVWTLQDMRGLFMHNLIVINGVLLAFALLGLTLASVGLYGVVAHNVSQRMSEFGIRLALGATAGDVLRLVLRQSLVLTTIGLGFGAVGSFLLGLALRKGLGPLIAQNYLILAGTTVVIFAIALISSWLPARRATSADPVAALHAE